MSHHSRILSLIFFGLILGIGSQFFVDQDPSLTSVPEFQIATTAVQDLSAIAYQVFDVETGGILLSENSTTTLPIASVTKLFSAAVFRADTDLQATYTIAYADVLTEGRAGKLQAGEIYSGRELLFPLLLESSNDAGTTLARVHPELISNIHTFTDEIGLADTSIADASGLSAANVSTAADLSMLLQQLAVEQPYILDISRTPEYYSETNGWINNSPFITDAAYRGGKHGFTYEANRTVAVIFAESFTGGERQLGYVVLGSEDLVSDMSTLRQFVAENVRFE